MTAGADLTWTDADCHLVDHGVLLCRCSPLEAVGGGCRETAEKVGDSVCAVARLVPWDLGPGGTLLDSECDVGGL